MATTPKVLFRGAATTSVGTTLYTCPSATTTIVSNIAVTNTASASATYTISLDSVILCDAVAIPADTTVFIDLKQVLVASDTITGGASATSVNLHISGVEIA
jgi:hypothetical protein